jgi:hypothetical protein
MSQKVHPKSVRHQYLSSSDVSIYTEGPIINILWGKILSYRFYISNLLKVSKVVVTKAPSARRMKKSKYSFSHVNIKMFGPNVWYSPILSTFLYKNKKGLSYKYLPYNVKEQKRRPMF